MEPHCELRLSMLSQPSVLAAVRKTVEAWCELAGGSEHVCCQVGLALDEALTNVIRHGYDNRPDGQIDMLFACEGSIIEITIEDQAKQVPIETIASRPLDDVRPGGLGVHLIRNAMDKAVWSHREGGGMQLYLKRDVSAETAPEKPDNGT